MRQTRIEVISYYLYKYINTILCKRLNELSLSVLSMLLGFFISTALSTIPGQTGDWGLVGAAIIVTFYEIISKKVYPKNSFYLVPQVNNIKIGIVYGLFVDAFKLGS
uniref:Uncharacterized protein ycf20 n=1 Tax=Palmaria palmata TaxID=2822 RepID=A0A1C9CH43_PALPL|nr:hypothetical protein Palma_074 [Palmaria palmata]AOM67706.1 hypothetical protein Palma_074 [Palmaria palmata]